MNMILVEPCEVAEDGSISLSGRRFEHISKVLKLGAGSSFRVGIINGKIGTATITETAASSLKAVCACDIKGVSSGIDVLLAMPRPKVMKRLWAPLAMLGVERIFIINADKVEKYYFDTHVLEEAFFRPRLIEGLEQSCRTSLPQVIISRTATVSSDSLLSSFSGHTKVIAQPSPAQELGQLRDYERLVIAIGPEGGWTDRELQELSENGFNTISLGPAPLKVDVAVVSLISVSTAVRRLNLTD